MSHKTCSDKEMGMGHMCSDYVNGICFKEGPCEKQVNALSWGKARKKPVEVEYRAVNPEWLDEDESGQWCEKIHTREGILWAYQNDDYIIRGIEGEIYPIKKRIFEKTYDVTQDYTGERAQ